MDALVELAYRWYSLMSQWSTLVAGPLQQLLGSQNIPGLSALLLGLMGGLAAKRVTDWIRQRIPRWGSPAFWLGVAFPLGFCPTMAMIFFGGLVPLVVQAQAGMVLSVIFAVGTALPVILWAAVLTAGREAGRRWVKQVRQADRYVRAAAAALFLLLGLNDILLYWFA